MFLILVGGGVHEQKKTTSSHGSGKPTSLVDLPFLKPCNATQKRFQLLYLSLLSCLVQLSVQPPSLLRTVPESWNAFVYIVKGEGLFGAPDATPTPAHHCLLFGPGEGASVWNKSSKPLRFVLIGGRPLNEPVAQHGPFVMNTRNEIIQAFRDYQLGKMVLKGQGT